MKKLIVTAGIAALLFAACKSNIEPKQLYGKWKYTRVQNLKATPPDSIRRVDLEEQQPYIVFGKDNSVQIFWDGKVLSHGKFTTDGDNIKVQEQLPDGKTREFPFYVSKLDGKTLIFESMGTDGSTVTAVKE